eukprot:g1970.t1 g1970   contig11:444376-445004(-)
MSSSMNNPCVGYERAYTDADEGSWEYAATELDWSDKECYKHFPSFLEGYASTVWEEVLEELKDEDQAKAGSFKSIAIPRFYKKLGGDDRKQGDTILYYLEHKWKKPMAKTPQQHYHRMVELLQIVEKLNKSQPTNKEKRNSCSSTPCRLTDDEDLLGRVLPFMASMHDKELKLQAAKKSVNFQASNG